MFRQNQCHQQNNEPQRTRPIAGAKSYPQSEPIPIPGALSSSRQRVVQANDNFQVGSPTSSLSRENFFRPIELRQKFGVNRHSEERSSLTLKG